MQRQFIRFLIVGMANTAISLVVYRALLALGVWYVVSAPIAWAAGVVNGFDSSMTHTWTIGTFTGSIGLPASAFSALPNGWTGLNSLDGGSFQAAYPADEAA